MRRFDTLINALNTYNGDAIIASIAATPDMRSRVDFSDPYYRTPARFVACRVPRQAIAPLVGRIDETPLRLVPPHTEALTLLVTYASAIAEDLPLATPELQRLSVTHIGATRDE